MLAFLTPAEVRRYFMLTLFVTIIAATSLHGPLE
jgi:hypothetical protein